MSLPLATSFVQKADFIALIVNQRRSSQPYPNVCASVSISLVIEQPDMRRLSVLTVTRKRSRASSPIG